MADRHTYPPGSDFVQHAYVSGPDAYRQLYQRAADNPEAFWGDLAEKELFWFEKWSQTLDWKSPFARWFVGGKTNASSPIRICTAKCRALPTCSNPAA